MALTTTKSVCFNMNNPEEKDLLIGSERYESFSGYVKELMKQDQKKNNPAKLGTPLQSTGKSYKPPLMNK